jgi:hypothetical protein
MSKGDKTGDSVRPRQNQTEPGLDTGASGTLTEYPFPMELTFYRAADSALRFGDERNRGIEVVRGLLEELERGGVRVRRVDPRTLTSQQLLDAYAQATIPAICKKYDVKSIFGTSSQLACWFGCQVPVLLVEPTRDDVGDTYPHCTADNVIVTIHQFVTETLAAMRASRARKDKYRVPPSSNAWASRLRLF